MLILVVLFIFGVIGAAIASGKGKNPFLWFVICFLTGLIGLLIIMFSKNENAEREKNEQQRGAKEQQIIANKDDEEWAVLVKYDDELSAAVAKLEAYGDEAAGEFRRIYTTVKDKSKIDAIVNDVVAKALDFDKKISLAKSIDEPDASAIQLSQIATDLAKFGDIIKSQNLFNEALEKAEMIKDNALRSLVIEQISEEGAAAVKGGA